MLSRMHPRYYLSTDNFEQEQKKIFRKVWLFAGLKTLLSEHNNFITRKIAGIPVVIQNFNGELRAFENVCLHRSAPLQSAFTGCRPLVCPYHAWKYGSDGTPDKIPHCESLYQFDTDEKASLKLREFSLRAVGNILFINMDNNPFPLEEQFSADFLSLIADSSNAYDTEVMVTTWHCKFNWKLIYENLRDANHVAFIHPKSLAPAASFKPVINHQAANESCNAMSDTSAEAMRKEMRRFSYGGPEGKLGELKSFGWHDFVKRWRFSEVPAKTTQTIGHNQAVAAESQDDAYFNWLAFPNLHIASGDGGHSFVIEHHIPVSPDRTDLEIWRFTARKTRRYQWSSQVLLSGMHHGKLIVGEDVDILEKVQSALHVEAPIPRQGAYESTNRLIERWYATVMETDDGV